MVGHVLLDVAAGNPFEDQFQKALAVHLTADIFVAKADAGAVRLGEVPLGISEPGSGVNGVAELLDRQARSHPRPQRHRFRHPPAERHSRGLQGSD